MEKKSINIQTIPKISIKVSLEMLKAENGKKNHCETITQE